MAEDQVVDIYGHNWEAFFSTDAQLTMDSLEKRILDRGKNIPKA